MKAVSDRTSRYDTSTLVAADTLLTQADVKSITLTSSSFGSGCELVFPEAMRERLKKIRLNETTGQLAVVLGGDTLVCEVSTLNINDLKISVQAYSKTTLARLEKLAATISPK